MSTARHHAEWLSLTEVSGPFLSMPVLLRVFPQGLDAHEPEHKKELQLAYEEWQEAHEGGAFDSAIHHAWVLFVLRESLGYTPEVLAERQALPVGLEAQIALHAETLRPDLVLLTPTGSANQAKPRLLVAVHPARQDLDRPVVGRRWSASPATRMMELLHATGVRLGLVTNGERWMLVHAPRGETTGFASWYASLWMEEPLTLRAFRSLLSVRRFFGVADTDTPESQYAQSATDQQDVTTQLGLQVRHAVEVLVQAVDRVDKDHNRTLLAGVDEKQLYAAALSVMMRLVFLFSAEERKLLLLGDPIYDQNYAVSTLRAQLREAADRHGEEVLERRNDAWGRLLATFRAVHAGLSHDRLSLPAYGGALFDPDRYPFLEGRRPATSWGETPAAPLPIHNRTVLHLLEALQILQVKVPGGGPAEARQLSFRALDIEQIGHVYEGLLDHGAVRAGEPILGLAGAKGLDPEVTLSALEARRGQGDKALVDFLREATGRSESALRNALAGLQFVDDRRLLVACDNDEALAARVRPFAALLRGDTSGYPVVIAAGSVYVTQIGERRSTGTHYTPRSLTEPIVQHTLDPLVYAGMAEGIPPSPETLRPAVEILALKVCDFACGSGAFLVQACRYLADKLVEAWKREEERGEAAVRGQLPAGGVVRTSPWGQPSRGGVQERLLPADSHERLVLARRLVADRCLYGVDKNPQAVEMAKLSLWLITLQRERPFTFLDHALRCGDSLLGLSSADQLVAFDLDPASRRAKELQLFGLDELCRSALRAASQKRRQLESFPVETVRDADEKQRLLREAEAGLGKVRLLADLVVGEALATAGRRPGAEEQDRWSHVVHRVISALKPGLPAEDQAQLWEWLGQDASTRLGGRRPFHWFLEFPEVFLRDLSGVESARAPSLRSDRSPSLAGSAVPPAAAAQPSGFDALIGNPPFQGGQKITGALGTDYRDYLVEHLARGQRGSADLCSYFFLRAGTLLRGDGDFGLLATNTIAQGDTREVGLDQLVKGGFTITRASPSRKWPGEANLEIAEVWLHRGPWKAGHVLEAKPVTGITSLLAVPGKTLGTPHRLLANSGKSFIGSYVLGMGFVLTPDEAQSLIENDQRNKEVLFPYLNGEDLNSSLDQSPSRWVINFHDWPLEQAEAYPECMKIVLKKVKPERDSNTFSKSAREKWWQFERGRPELYTTIAGMKQVLIRARVANLHSVCWCSTGWIYSEQTVVFVDCPFQVLQSTLHDIWAREYSSSMRTDVRYAPSDCFDTFPFPLATRDSQRATLDSAYHEHRRQIMLSRQQGLTKTYNRFHNPDEHSADIVKLRELHVQMDNAVRDAYGWPELDLQHGFHQTKQGMRFTLGEAARREVLDRLLALNHERHADEVLRGLHDKKKPAKKGAGRKKSAADQGTLFE